MPRKIFTPRLIALLSAWVVMLGLLAGSSGQELPHAEVPPVVYRLKIVLRVEADEQTLSRISARCPIPVNWPEQSVKLLSETKSPECKSREQIIKGMGAVWVVECPRLIEGQSFEVERVYELTRSPVITRVDPKTLKKPSKLPQEIRGYLRNSPGIETTDLDLRKLARELGESGQSPWEFAQAASQWIGENVQFELGTYRGAKAAYQNREGDCEDSSALFIALCRIAEIPARTVWVEGHAYPEFYLEDGSGRGHWIPVEPHGPKDFGSIRETRPILQKGDHYRDEVAKQSVRYLPQQAVAQGGPAKLAVTRTILREEPVE